MYWLIFGQNFSLIKTVKHTFPGRSFQTNDYIRFGRVFKIPLFDYTTSSRFLFLKILRAQDSKYIMQTRERNEERSPRFSWLASWSQAPVTSSGLGKKTETALSLVSLFLALCSWEGKKGERALVLPSIFLARFRSSPTNYREPGTGYYGGLEGTSTLFF